jgi:hypothetical protein
LDYWTGDACIAQLPELIASPLATRFGSVKIIPYPMATERRFSAIYAVRALEQLRQRRG